MQVSFLSDQKQKINITLDNKEEEKNKLCLNLERRSSIFDIVDDTE